MRIFITTSVSFALELTGYYYVNLVHGRDQAWFNPVHIPILFVDCPGRWIPLGTNLKILQSSKSTEMDPLSLVRILDQHFEIKSSTLGAWHNINNINQILEINSNLICAWTK